eukprot:CAMPEP_0113901158 /NCGR_PEP_ID=MMETSP0780_2-20120614/21090_1 /TAXON_ID=652834 /ORGANISM="Palpitomonas bilix" /LENGTH=243 /DNA_ID=CAMNT_0000893723 /DNA_START=246 /DNA_END=977 /DNA_ORIENTATION=- /assembly_acc=CAM_ASM_000599
MTIQIGVLLFNKLFGLDRNKFVAGWLRRISGRFTSRSHPLFNFKLLGDVPEKLPEKCVIVCNHISNADVAAITTLFPFTCKFVGRGELRYIPFMGWMMVLAGDVFVDYKKDKDRTDGTKAVNRDEAYALMKRYVSEGTPVALFPEGWRSRNQKILFFKDGAFTLAKECNAAILPIALVGTEALWPMGYDAPCGGRAFMKIGKPISAEEVAASSMDDLKKASQQAIIDLKAEIEEEVNETDKAR